MQVHLHFYHYYNAEWYELATHSEDVSIYLAKEHK